MKYALIGCGRIATNHIKAVLNNHLELAAVCDVLPQQMENLLAKHELQNDSSIHRYTDYREMIEKEQPQLVGIATESGVHAQIALFCIDHGVNVIIEKPMAMSIADANEIIRRSQEKGVKISACHQNRFNVAVQQMRKALEAGRFGRLSHGSIHVRWNRNHGYYDQAKWRGTWAQDGGALMNQCIHSIDLLRWMLGDGVTEKDLSLTLAPSAEERAKLDPFYMSYFVPWNSYKNYQIAKAHGFHDLTHEWDRTHHAENFDQIDSRAYLVHSWLKYPKFGHAAATDYTARYIRYGMMTREEAIPIIKERDGKLDPLCVRDFCEFCGYTETEFWAILDKFYNRDLFEKNEYGEWQLKHPIWEENK